MTLKSFNVWVILIPIKYSWTFNVVIFLILESLNAEIYAIYLPYGFIIRDYLVSYYTAQNIACNRSFCRRLNACTSGARNDHVSSLNCDRRFRFLFQECRSRNQHWKNSNTFCRVNQADRAQNYWPACQNFGVPCPEWMSCKCALNLSTSLFRWQTET